MKQAELRKALSEMTGLSIRKTDEVLKTLNGLILDCMDRGDTCWLGKLGSFRLGSIAGFQTKNQFAPGETLTIKPRKRMLFKAGPQTRRVLARVAERELA